METELFIATFDSMTGADAMLETLKDLQDDDFIELVDAVVVTKDVTGTVEVRQPLEVGPGKGAAFGALTGAVVGLLGGPAGVIVGLVSGAVTGGVTGAALEAGLPEDDIRELASAELQPDESALMVYFDEVWIDQIEQAARELGANIVRQVIAAERQAEREQAAEVRKAKIDAAYKSWQARIDQQRETLTSLRQQIHNDVQSKREAIQQQIEATNAKLNDTYHNILHTLEVWQQQLDAEISQLEAESKQATAQAKANVDQRLADAKQARETLRSNVKATLTTRVNNLKADIERLKTQAANARGEAKAQLDKDIAEFQAELDAENKRLDELDAAYGDAWDTLVKSTNEALDTFEVAARKAEANYANPA